jgi:hypothetical protein
MTVENIVSKVQKLLRLSTANSNAAEAASAAAKAQGLIDEHNLTAAMLALDDAAPEVDEPIIDFQTSGAPLDSQKQQQRWRGVLALTVAKLNGCRVYRSGGALALVGRPTDAETVRYLYGYLSREVERLAAQQVGMGRTWRNNFRLGVVDTINGKLHEQRRQFESTAHATAREAGSVALMRMDQAMAKIDARGSSVDAWLKSNLKLRAGHSSRTSYDRSAREAGKQAGQSINVGGARGGAIVNGRGLTA